MTTLKYRKQWEFQVSVSVPFPMCNTFHKEAEITKRVRYVYPIGYVDQVSCQTCFNKAVEDAQAKAKNQPSGWESVY